eukprot:2210628-Rhodomonas_salina.2
MPPKHSIFDPSIAAAWKVDARGAGVVSTGTTCHVRATTSATHSSEKTRGGAVTLVPDSATSMPPKISILLSPKTTAVCASRAAGRSPVISISDHSNFPKSKAQTSAKVRPSVESVQMVPDSGSSGK